MVKMISWVLKEKVIGAVIFHSPENLMSPMVEKLSKLPGLVNVNKKPWKITFF